VTALPSAPELAALLCRSGWRQLSLSAELTRRTDLDALARLTGTRAAGTGAPGTDLAGPGPAGETPRPAPGPQAAGGQWQETVSNLLVAPGGRFRLQELVRRPEDRELSLLVCDGESCWRLRGDQAERRDAGLAHPDLAKLLDPSWLPAWYVLNPDSVTTWAGRAAWHVTATPRPARTQSGRPDLLDLMIDAELGIVLQLAVSASGALVELTALGSLGTDPAQARELARFSPPLGTITTSGTTAAVQPAAPRGTLNQVADTAAGLTAAALDYAVKRGSRPGSDSTAPPIPLPRSQPGAAAFQHGGSRVTGPGAALLYQAGLPGLDVSAEVRQWIVRDAVLAQARQHGSALRRPLAGLVGPDSLWGTLGDQVTGVGYRTARLRVAIPGRYRIDCETGHWDGRQVIACDGQRLRTAYEGRLVEGPVRPLDDQWARMADPAWLLGPYWRLSAAEETTVDGRAGLLIWADAQPDGGRGQDGGGWALPDDDSPFDRVAVIVDTATGLLLRCVGYYAGQPAACLELAGLWRHRDEGTSAFIVTPAAGQRVVSASSPLARVDLRRPAEAARTAGSAGLAGAAMLSGWLHRRPGATPRPKQNQPQADQQREDGSREHRPSGG
jgi:hypothetical protein